MANSNTCVGILSPSDTSSIYNIEIEKFLVVFATVVFCFVFVAPACLHLAIKFYYKHDLLYHIYKKKFGKEEYRSSEDLLADQKKPPRVFLSCKEIVYAVPMNKEMLKKTQSPKGTKLQILKGVTVGYKAGSLNAIMGPSGCGKSTLLDILADRKQNGDIQGTVTLNGFERDKFFKRASVYVMQFDSLFPYLTVRETFLFAAEFRLEMSNEAKIQRVQEVIKQLDLEKAADTMIGDDLNPGARGISGGQRRRVTVGIELLASPRLLFMDEPTTGLDAFDSLSLIKLLRKLANSGCTIICTIHQPRVEIFNLFDNLLLMVAGEVAFSGPINEIGPYLAASSINIPENTNVGDFIVDLTYSKEGEDKNEKSQPELLVQHYKSSMLRESNDNFVDQIIQRSSDLPEPMTNVSTYFKKDPSTYTYSVFSIPYANPIHRQIFTLSRRSSLNAARNRTTLINLLINCAQFAFFGILVLQLLYNILKVMLGLLWLGSSTGSLPSFVPEATKDNIKSRTIAGFLYTMVNVSCVFEVDVIAEAFTEKKVFLREHASGAYSVIAYHIFWATKLFFRSIRNGVLYSILAYFSGSATTDISFLQFIIFTLYMVVLSACGSGIALLLVVAIPDVRGAADIHNSVLGFMGTFAGFFLLPSLIPAFLKYYTYYLSFYHYAYEGLLWNYFARENFNTVLQTLGATFAVNCHLNMWSNLLILMVYPIVFHLVAALCTGLHTRPRSFWGK